MKRINSNNASANTIGNFYRTRLAESAPPDYVLNQEILSFLGEINKHIEPLLSGGIDEGNANVLDNMIDDIAKRAANDIEQQYATHVNLIKRLDASREGDMRESELRLKDLRQGLSETEARIEVLKRYRNRTIGAGQGRHADIQRIDLLAS